ncbi:7444_t:CDS:1, partial [Scutellospora calospora]
MQDYVQQESEFQAGIPPRLVSVFYSMFDPDKGPQVVFDVPEGFIISKYIVPTPALCGHF